MKHSAFGRNALSLGASATIVQAVDVVATPVITRIYAPELFGPYGVFLAVLMMSSVLATMRYERRVMLLRGGREESGLVLGVLTLAGLLAATAALAGLLAGAAGWRPAGGAATWGLLLGAGLFATAANTMLEFVAIRRSAFRLVAVTRLVGATVLSGLKLVPLLGLAPAMLLLPASSVASLAAGGTLLGLAARRNAWLTPGTGRRQRLAAWGALRRGWSLAGPLSASSLLNTGSGHAPVALTGALLSAGPAGLFYLAHRVLAKPMGILINSVADSSFPEFATRPRSELAGLYRRRRWGVFALAVVPFVVLGLTAPWVFRLVFGAHWVGAGQVARALVPGLLVQVVFTPFSNLFTVLEAQRAYFRWAVLRFAGVCAGMVAGYLLTGTVVGMAAGYSAAIGLAFLYQHLLIARLLVGHSRAGERA